MRTLSVNSAEPQDISGSDSEVERLQALHRYGVLDTPPEQGYDDVTELASFICDAPISLVSLVDSDRQWFKSERGLGIAQTPRDQSFCAHALGGAEMLVVEDAHTDPRFRDNPLVLGDPSIRFYAGAPIVDPRGNVLGTVCVIDTKPRTLSDRQTSALKALARQVVALLEQRRAIQSLEESIHTTQAADLRRERSERRLQVFVDSQPTLAWMANKDGYIFWYNHRWYEYTGTTPAQMEGWGWQSVHDPGVLPLVMERWKASIANGAPFEMIFPLRGADGVLRSFLTRIIPARDADGEVNLWFGTNTEIDELHRTRTSLEESQAVLNQVLHATNDAVISINRDWTISYLNPVAEKLYGTAGHFIGKNLWTALPIAADAGYPFHDHYRRAMDEGVTGRFEAEFPADLQITLGVEVYPSPHGIVTFSRDITQTKKASAALMQTEKLAAVGRLASSIAHEINNPLESVTNLLYLARVSTESEEINAYLDSAERELRRVSAITNQTLRFYRQTTRALPVLGDDLYREILSLYQGRLLNSGIGVEQRLRTTQAVTCMEGEIRQVLSNLVANAIDAMPNGGRLLLRTRSATHWSTGRRGIAFTVADTGTGMAPQVLARIFEAFYSTKGIGGTGLGLWVSREIVDRHHGRLQTRSAQGTDLRNPGRHGTVFMLFLPEDAVSVRAS